MCVPHVVSSSWYLGRYYQNLVDKKGAGRARIALIRKLYGIMRRMLLNSEQYRWTDRELHGKKVVKYERMSKKVKEEYSAA